MEKPETWDCTAATTVGQIRQQYRDRERVFDNLILMVTSGTFEECAKVVGESILNQGMTELVNLQEYTRERECANWGWDRNKIDFSKHAECVL